MGSDGIGRRVVYPGWVKTRRIRLFWFITAGILAVAIAMAVVWPVAILLALLALPFLYIAIVIMLAAHALSERGGDLQRRIHALIADAVAGGGRTLDVGCGSGQLLIRLAKTGAGPFVGIDYWGDDWQYSKAQCDANARIEGVAGTEFQRASAAALPFDDDSFDRVVSCMTFHEVRDAPDKAACLTEALRVLKPGGRFAFVDPFSDENIYGSRGRARETLIKAGAELDSERPLAEIIRLDFPLNLKQVLGRAVLISGTKR